MKTKRFTICDLKRVSGKVSGTPTLTPALSPRRGGIIRRWMGGTRCADGLTGKLPSAATLQCNSERGIALVITLILLSVTLVMAIAFLAISRRERGSVSTTEDTTTAKFAADAALAKAEARIVSQMLTATNPYVFGLAVSTNYANQLGFVPNSANPTNVNYNYYASAPFGPGGGGPLSAADLEQNIANLYYDPRPPVYYSNDFRYYLDLNRNGQYDTNGWVVDLDKFGNPIVTAGVTNYSLEVGDPEWIGVLEHPDQPHGPNNPFIARYCFIAVPANSLDLNYIHNQALSPFDSGNGLSLSDDDYYRNQGIGTWEINLAAFLTDLNTNIWDPQNPVGNEYQYFRPVNSPNNGVAFNDAFVLLTNRYASLYPSQATVQNLFGANGINAFEYNGIDAYIRGPLQTTFDANYAPEALYNDYWVGAENTNNFFTPDDLFNTNKTANFGIRLQNAGINKTDAEGNVGTTNSTYDRYTFYRMLAQLGTDTQPASGKINLNYQNARVAYVGGNSSIGTYGPVIESVASNITIIPNLETNFQQWSPEDFFTVAANQMLHTYTTEWFEASPSNYMQTYYGIGGFPVSSPPFFGVSSYTNMDGMNVTNIQYLGQTNQIPSFGVTNIPVYVNGSFVYSSAVNRILQLAANIYDASTNAGIPNIASNYPSVFCPVFERVVEKNYFLNQIFTNIYIRGYRYIQEPLPNNTGNLFSTPIELNTLPLTGLGPTYSTNNVWGIPWIVGAKKGFPNFNGFELDNTIFIERELQFTRNSAAPGPSGSIFPYGRTYATNQMYLIGISNAFAMDDWNSYVNPYNHKVSISAYDNLGVGLTNNAGFAVENQFYANAGNGLGIGIQPWPGQLFVLPLGTNVTVFQNISPPPTPASSNGVYVYYYTPRNVTVPSTPPYSFTGPCFIPASLDPNNYLDAGTPQLPQFGLVTTNHLQAYMLDTDAGGNVHILDYVQLGSMNSSLNINAAIQDLDDNGLWSTNSYQAAGTPWGVVNQYTVSSIGGTVPTEDQDGGGAGGAWATTAVPGIPNDSSPAAQQAFFSAFFSPNDDASYNGILVTNIETSIQAPFTPMRQILQRYVFQANDPLVHYLSSDMNDINDDLATNRVNINSVQTNVIKTIGTISDRYLPWGGLNPGALPNASGNPDRQLLPAAVYFGNPVQAVTIDQNQYSFAYRDPLVWSPDNWDFPTNKYPTVGWLGRVHRGTPWQSVYLKSTNIWSLSGTNNGAANQGPATWQVWTGDLNADDAYNEIPAQDRLLFDIFTATPDDDATRGQVSVNIGSDDPNNMLAGLSSWSALLSGTVAFSTNNMSDNVINYSPGNQEPVASPWQESGPYLGLVTNQPYGIYNPAMATIVNGINSTRTNIPNIDGLPGVFEHVGDILATPELSDGSPYLNVSDPSKQEFAVSDEMYEWLPQQMLGLMTVSGTPQNPPRYVVYCYGQTLKPAVNGIVQSGSFAGLCTNYQVTAESAARVVISVQNTPTPANPTATPHVVVQQYNALPPD
jgi:hypothetical protein